MNDFYLKMVAYALKQKDWESHKGFIQKIINKNQLTLNYANDAEFDFATFFHDPKKATFILKNGFEFEGHDFGKFFKEVLYPKGVEVRESELNKNKKIINFVMEKFPKVVEETVEWTNYEFEVELFLKFFRHQAMEYIFKSEKIIKDNMASNPDLIHKAYYNFFAFCDSLFQAEQELFTKWEENILEIYQRFPISDKILWQVLNKNVSSMKLFDKLFELRIITPEKEKAVLLEGEPSLTDIAIKQIFKEREYNYANKPISEILKKLESTERKLTGWGFVPTSVDVLENINTTLKEYQKTDPQYLKFISNWHNWNRDFKPLKL